MMDKVERHSNAKSFDVLILINGTFFVVGKNIVIMKKTIKVLKDNDILDNKKVCK
jgi:hypothetical protein